MTTQDGGDGSVESGPDLVPSGGGEDEPLRDAEFVVSGMSSLLGSGAREGGPEELMQILKRLVDHGFTSMQSRRDEEEALGSYSGSGGITG
jgi:hypothetical protein